MSVDGITCASSPLRAGSCASPTDALSELLLVLRQARQAHRETERAFSDAGVQAAEAQALNASDKAEATRNSALLQFCINAGQNITSFASDIAFSNADDPARARDVNSAVQREATTLAGLEQAADSAFGFGRDVAVIDAETEQVRAQQSRFNAYEDRARTVGDELDDAIVDVRQTLRDVVNGQNGGQS